MIDQSYTRDYNSSFDYSVGTVQLDNNKGHNVSLDKDLLWEMNDAMRQAVLPVTIFVGMEVAVGFIGNIFVLYVFIFRYHVCNFRYFVLCLACVDFLSTLTTMPGEMVTQLYWYVYPLPIYCKIKSFFNVFTVSAEALCLFTIAVDRYRKICKPFEKQIKPNIAKILCLIIYCVAAVIALPVAFLWGTNTHEKHYKGKTVQVTVCEKDEQFVGTKYPITYVIIIESIVALCLLVMLILYIFVAKELIHRRANRRLGSGSPMVHSPTNPSIAGSPQYPEERPNDNENDFPESSEITSRANNSVSCDNSSVGNGIEGVDIEMSVQQEGNTPNNNNNVTGNGTTPHQTQASSPTRQRRNNAARVRRKTLIMFILTVVFICTTILYLTLLAFIARADDILQDMNDSQKAAYFFFFRLVFINHVINPFVYGFLDTQFISGIKELHQKLMDLLSRFR